jgi:hypothetical protein
VYFFTLQFAVNVIFFVIFTISVDFIRFPSSVYHPSKSYPSFVGSGNSPYVCPYVTSLEFCSSVTPFPSNVIVYLFASHCVYNVISLSGIYDVSIFVPPFSCVNQPLNVYPSFVGIGNVTLFEV